MRRLLIFLKYPSPGQVKTRLAENIGPRAAKDVARKLSELTLERIVRFRSEAVVCVNPPDSLPLAHAWLGAGWRICPQQGPGLGERLAHATNQAFSEGARHVVILGMDSPWIGEADIEYAFEVLRCKDLVIGPTEDGGYYLIGLSKESPSLFNGILWGSKKVFQQTISKAHALALRSETLKKGYDLDRMEDVKRFLHEERHRGCTSPILQAIDALIHEEATCRD